MFWPPNNNLMLVNFNEVYTMLGCWLFRQHRKHSPPDFLTILIRLKPTTRHFRRYSRDDCGGEGDSSYRLKMYFKSAHRYTIYILYKYVNVVIVCDRRRRLSNDTAIVILSYYIYGRYTIYMIFDSITYYIIFIWSKRIRLRKKKNFKKHYHNL